MTYVNTSFVVRLWCFFMLTHKNIGSTIVLIKTHETPGYKMQQIVKVFHADFSHSAGNKAAPMQDILQNHVSALNREGLKVASFHWPENSERSKFIAFLCERM